VSTAFIVKRDGRPVAHAGVLQYDILLDGVRVPVAGLHAVCTEPSYRGRGLARRALGEALSWVDERGLPAVLATDKPGVYEPHGFRVVSERRWRLPVCGGGGATRGLSADEPANVALLQGLHARRAPLSQRLCSLAPTWMFGMCETLATDGFGHLHHVPALDAIVAWERGADGRIVVLDVVAPALPGLEDLLAHLPSAPAVELAFHVDQFGEESVEAMGGRPVPAPEDDLWMVRGLEPPAGEGQMPVLARH
jgi:hypothetical protein